MIRTLLAGGPVDSQKSTIPMHDRPGLAEAVSRARAAKDVLYTLFSIDWDQLAAVEQNGGRFTVHAPVRCAGYCNTVLFYLYAEGFISGIRASLCGPKGLDSDALEYAVEDPARAGQVLFRYVMNGGGFLESRGFVVCWDGMKVLGTDGWLMHVTVPEICCGETAEASVRRHQWVEGWVTGDGRWYEFPSVARRSVEEPAA